MSSKSSIKWDPDLVDENQGHIMFTIITIMTVLVVLSTSTRVIMKLWCRLTFQAEDYLIIMGLALNVTCNALEYEAISLGFGRHLQFLTREQERKIRMWNQFGILFANLAIWAVKLSICFFILALIRGTHRRSQWIVYGLMVMTSIAHGCQTIVWATQARPLEKLWHPEVPGKISPRRTLVNSIIAFTSISSVTDLFYAIAPIYFFGGLQMNLKRKITVIGLTGSGLLVFTSSIVRVAFVNDFFHPDITWALQRVYICTIVERNLAEFIADLPAIFPLIRSLSSSAVTMITQASRTGSKPGTYGQTTDLTIGSTKRFNSSKRGDFAAYGKHGQFTTIRNSSDDDEIELTQDARRQRPALRDGAIKVEVNIDMESHERTSKDPSWPKGSLRPDP